ncbi:MAG: exo 1,3/1,4-beta-D-glucan glucohydrolase [Alphaproteobacteria bacterium]|nr:exo 1,3/1,4-beta-D-glucan glucohydrolase [Alphaproteobacteria bacterium]
MFARAERDSPVSQIRFKWFGAIVCGLLVASCSGSDSPEKTANAILAKMTIEEKVGQVIQGDISSVTPEDAKNYNLGSVLNGGNSAPGGGKTAAWQQWIDAADAYWKASTDKSDGGIGIPLLWGTDAVHGHNNLQMAVIFPHNSALGAAGDADLMKRIGSVTASEVKATALDWVFAPTLAVARDDRWGRAYESYSENAELVSELGEGILIGLQGKPNGSDFLNQNHVIATAKHFVGDGGTEFGIDKGDTIGSMDLIKRIHARPYRNAIENDVQTVMASFSSVNGEKMHGSKALLTEVLRDQMGFNGFVIGDWNGHAEIPGCSATDCPDALLAGVDMYMAPDSWQGLYESLLKQVKDGTVPMERLDEAVLRILTVKVRSGLFEAGLPSKRPGVDRSTLGNEKHRRVAREAVRKSLVLLKNENSILPFKPDSHVAVVGKAANSMSQQTGGWTLSWQGNDNANAEFENGQTILGGLKEKVEKAGGKVTFSDSVDGLQGSPDLVIYVFGEEPYAEFFGDMSDLVFEFDGGNALEDLTKLEEIGAPVVSIFLTGRPLWVNPHINRSDAFVVGWLPGTEAGGISDVLTSGIDGQPVFDFVGKLSFSWPSDGIGQPIDQGSKSGVQFPFGFGMSYQDQTKKFATLSEDPGIPAPEGSFAGDIMSKGSPENPFGFFLGDSSNWRTPAQAFLTESLGSGIGSKGIDYRAQEDARQLEWRGRGRATASIQTQRAVDFTSVQEVSDLSLKIFARVDKKPSSSVLLNMSCGDNCGGQVDISAILNAAEIGKWQDLSVPLSCFTDQGMNLKTVEAPMILETTGELTLSLTTIQLEDGGNTCP